MAIAIKDIGDEYESFDKEVKKSGTGAVVYLPRGLIGKKVILMIAKKDLEDLGTRTIAEA